MHDDPSFLGVFQAYRVHPSNVEACSGSNYDMIAGHRLAITMSRASLA